VASALAAVARPPPPAEALIVPPSDKRAYRRFVLPNGMTVLLVHDPSMVEAASKGVDEEDGGETDKKQGGGSKEGNNPARAPGAASGSSSGSDASGSSSGSSGSDDDDADDDGGSSGAGSPSAAPHHAPTKKAAAAVAVSTGSLADPPAFPGLAHYLEHMLFMGSAKYPDENDYDAFLAKHGGSSNAFTDMEETVYYFDCTPGALLPALDRFAQFFTCPLVKADALEREVGAVDNEFSGVLQSDGCRLAQLRAHTARRGHPYARFAWGNRASLADKPRAAGLDVRAAILDFYAAQYGAERMTLVVVGGQALAELAAAVGAAFGAVPSGVGPPPDHAASGAPYTGGALHISPAVKDGHLLTTSWCLPPLGKQYRSKAEDYLAHLIGHEGAGSLLAALKARGWATGLSAGVGEGGTDRSSAAYVFEVGVTLTDAGLAAGPGAGLAVLPLLFSYIGLLTAAGPQAWVHGEVAAIAAARFRFAEEEEAAEYAARLAGDGRRYPAAHSLAGPYLHDEWDAGLVADLTAVLTPGNARLDLQTSAAAAVLPPVGGEGGGGKDGPAVAPPGDGPPTPPPGRLGEWVASPGATKGVEPWFGLPYVTIPLPVDLLAEWGAAVAASAGEGKAGGGRRLRAGTPCSRPSPSPPPTPSSPPTFPCGARTGAGWAGVCLAALPPRAPRRPRLPARRRRSGPARPRKAGWGWSAREEGWGVGARRPTAPRPPRPPRLSQPLLPPACAPRPPSSWTSTACGCGTSRIRPSASRALSCARLCRPRARTPRRPPPPRCTPPSACWKTPCARRPTWPRWPA
jgi:nardilysin